MDRHREAPNCGESWEVSQGAGQKTLNGTPKGELTDTEISRSTPIEASQPRSFKPRLQGRLQATWHLGFAHSLAAGTTP
jgi:hypothetical protein